MASGTAAQLYLTFFLEAKDKEERDIMLSHLRRITGQDFGYNKMQWRRWIKMYRHGREDTRTPEERRQQRNERLRQLYAEYGEEPPESLLNADIR